MNVCLLYSAVMRLSINALNVCSLIKYERTTSLAGIRSNKGDLSADVTAPSFFMHFNESLKEVIDQ